MGDDRRRLPLKDFKRYGRDKMKSLKDTFELKNGVGIYCLGYGTWQTPDGEIACNSVKEAIKQGYRHIDAAAVYGNEKNVGQGILEGMKESGVSRDELFVTGKVWITERGYEKTLAAFEHSLADLKLDYLDLYLIHWPAHANDYENWEEINLESWRALTDLYRQGKIKAIGVSNFKPHHLKALMETEVPPMVNQIEFHPGYMQRDVLTYCQANHIQVEAWSPLGCGRVLSYEPLQKIAAKYQVSVAQLCLRWVLQNGVVPLSKSVTPSRIKENSEIFDFVISDEDMKTINEFPEIGYSGLDPDTFRG